MSTYEKLDLVLSSISALAIAFVVVQITTHNRQMHHDFEAMYLQRFWSLMERRSLNFAASRGRKRLSRTDLRTVHDYLELSNDQVELRRHGRVTDQTWRIWAPDIVRFVSQPVIWRVLEESEPQRYIDLRELLARWPSDPAWDPCSFGRFRRWARGL